MEIYVYTRDFEYVAVIDQYESFIWTERYSEAGDFELYTKVTPKLIDELKEERFLVIPDSNRFMVIEEISISTDTENGDIIKVKGRSAESLLERRIIWEERNYTNYQLQGLIKQLLIDNAIDPFNSNRKIPGLIFNDSYDPAVTSIVVDETHYYGENLYDAIKSLCDACGLGFKIELDDVNKKYIFSLYCGVDHSYNQEANPYVVFSKKYGNLLSSEYIKTTANIKNTAMILGEEGFWITTASHGVDSQEYYAQMKTETGDGSTFLDRREIFVDATDVARTVNQEDITTDSERTGSGGGDEWDGNPIVHPSGDQPVLVWSSGGQAPPGLQEGDYVQTNGGLWQITNEDDPFAHYNEDSGYWSTKVNTTTKIDNPEPEQPNATVVFTIDGQAPPGCAVGQLVASGGGGTWQIVEPGTPGANFNPQTGYYSVKVSDKCKADYLGGNAKSRKAGALTKANEEEILIVQSINGQAPPGCAVGTYVQTNGGLFQIVAPHTENAKFNPDSGYWSIKINDSTKTPTSSDTGNLTTQSHVMTGEEYTTILQQKGDEELSTYSATVDQSFSAEVVTQYTFNYGVDYFLGDILQVTNEYGISARVRVSEYIRSITTSGINYYPTFIIV